MKRTVQLSLLLLVIFVTGGVCGWFLRPINMIDQGKRVQWKSGTPGERAEAILSELAVELELSDSQRDAIRPIVENNFRTTAKIDRERMRLRKAAHDDVVQAIRGQLNPDQATKLEALSDSSNRRFRRLMQSENGDAAP